MRCSRRSARGGSGVRNDPALGRHPHPPRGPLGRCCLFLVAPYVGYLWMPVVLFGASWFVQAVRCRPMRALLRPVPQPLYSRPVLVRPVQAHYFHFLNGKKACNYPPPFPHALSARSRPPLRCPARPFSEPTYLPHPCSSRGAQSVPLCCQSFSVTRGVRGTVNEPRGPRTR